MSRRYSPGADAPRRDDDDFDAVPPGQASDDEDPEVADRPVRWWARDLGATPVIAVGLALGAVVVVIVVIVGLKPREPAPPQQNLVIQPPPQIPPPFGPAGAPRAVGAVEPGNECAISNLRKSQFPFSGFGGQPALMFDYEFPRGQPGFGPRLLVAVVTEPGGRPATATLSPLTDDTGTVSVAPLGGPGAFPRGTTVYVGDQINAGLDGLPKRVSNILMLE
jgi:hypothetical protein